MRALVVLAIVALGIVGALLHPLSLLLGALPFDTHAVLTLLNFTKELIADVLGWAVVGLLVLMLVLVIEHRLLPRKANGVRRPAGNLTSTKMAVGIIAYNEAGAIGDLVRAYKLQDDVLEVIVIDNNSSDGTAQIASGAGARVVLEPKQGYGYACIRALAECAQGARIGQFESKLSLRSSRISSSAATISHRTCFW
jgi:hypothetical protein